jgi:uncharacterized membrane protein YqjE
MDSSPPPFHLFASLRRLAETLISSIQNRIGLFATELEEEKCWLISTLLWSAAFVFFGGLSVVFLVGLILYLVPEVARGWVLSGFALLFVFITVNAAVGLRRSMRHKKPPLSHTLEELKKDLDWIRSQD